MTADDPKTAAMTLAQFKKSAELDVVLRHWRDLEVPQDCEFTAFFFHEGILIETNIGGLRIKFPSILNRL